jgi:arginine decarboxylase-like protein
MIRFAHYDTKEVVENIRKQAENQVRAGNLSAEEADGIIEDYRHDSSLYTYLENGR